MDKIIAIDFDGTLCDSRYPYLGEPNLNVLMRALYEKNKGSKLILWTCREGQLLTDAVKWCYDYGLVFDAINSNLPEEIGRWGTNPRKIFATEYWDDRNKLIKRNGEFEWTSI